MNALSHLILASNMITASHKTFLIYWPQSWLWSWSRGIMNSLHFWSIYLWVLPSQEKNRITSMYKQLSAFSDSCFTSTIVLLCTKFAHLVRSSLPDRICHTLSLVPCYNWLGTWSSSQDQRISCGLQYVLDWPRFRFRTLLIIRKVTFQTRVAHHSPNTCICHLISSRDSTVKYLILSAPIPLPFALFTSNARQDSTLRTPQPADTRTIRSTPTLLLNTRYVPYASAAIRSPYS